MLNSGKMSYCLSSFIRRNFSFVKDFPLRELMERRISSLPRFNSPKISPGKSPAQISLAINQVSTATASSMPLAENELSIICRPCHTHDRDNMIDFMKNLFVTREPLMKNLGATPQNSSKFIAYCIDEALEQNVSFAALDEETGELCGLRINAIGPSSGNELNVDFGPNINAIPKFLHHIESGMLDRLGTDRYMRHIAICVKPSSVQCGIATDLMRLSFEHAVTNKLHYMAAVCSWKLPYKLACKMGYEIAKELHYDEYSRSQDSLNDGQRAAFMSLAGAEGCARVMVKRLP